MFCSSKMCLEMLTHILVLPITDSWPSVMYKCNGHIKMCLDIIHPSIHPSFLRKSWIRPRTDEEKEKGSRQYFCNGCNKDSLLTYLTSSGPRDEVGMHYQMYVFLFKILITELHCNELGVFCMNGQI
jgi:hypothetical protein